MRAATQRRLTPALIIIAVIFGVLLMLLLFGVGRSVRWEAPRAPAPLPPAHSGVSLVAPTPLDAYAVVWQKPLFNPSRKPMKHAAEATTVGDLELTGVIITSRVKIALLREKKSDSGNDDNNDNNNNGSGSGNPDDGHTDLRLVEGKSLPDGSWTLAEVRPRSALFDSPQGRVELKLPDGAPITTNKNKNDSNQPAPGAAEARRTGTLPTPEQSGDADSQRKRRARQSDATLQSQRLQQIKAAIQKQKRMEQQAPATEEER